MSCSAYPLNITGVCSAWFLLEGKQGAQHELERAGARSLRRILEPPLVTPLPLPRGAYLPVLRRAPAAGYACPLGPQDEQHLNCG